MNMKATLVILIATLVLAANNVSARNLKTGEWDVRLILTSDTDDLADPYNVLGQRKPAVMGLDKFDLPELGQTFGGAYLSVIFSRPQWQASVDTFNTDFHPVAPKAADEWTFEVRSDDPARQLTLTWEGEKKNKNKSLKKMKRMVLIDLQENETVLAVIDGVPQSYSFIMNGYVRQFAWRLLTNKQLKAYQASGELPASKVSVAQAAPVVKAAPAMQARMVATTSSALPVDAAPEAAATSRASGWEPAGLGQGTGKGYTPNMLDGLPENPFAE